MSPRQLMFMPAAVATLALSLAVGAAAAQESPEPAGAMASAMPMTSMEPMTDMEPGLFVRHAWTRPSTMADLPAAVYLSIHNRTDVDDVLVGASSPAAAVAEMHQTSADDDGAMSMLPVDQIPIPAHGDAVLEPGGYHLMLIDLAEPLAEGDMVEVDLEFAIAEPQAVMVPVQVEGDAGDTDHGDMDMGGGEDEG